ncbi:hypothetical protein DXG01_000839 [Tephrocybe rancida]|nr:hypothetical protein DXG01_000839 [Tephrocybe rancida]
MFTAGHPDPRTIGLDLGVHHVPFSSFFGFLAERQWIEWHLRGWANWSIAGAVAVWLWTCPDAPPPPPMSTHMIHAALTRSTLTRDNRSLSTPRHDHLYPHAPHPIHPPPALVHPRTRALLLLTIAPLTLTFPFALTTYLFVAHTLNAPDSALGAALLAGGVTALVGLSVLALADTLYICCCVDRDMGEMRREEVFSTFEYRPQPQSQPQRQQPVSSTSARTQPPKKRVPATPASPPQPQYMPSESTSRYLPRQPLSPPSPSLYPI